MPSHNITQGNPVASAGHTQTHVHTCTCAQVHTSGAESKLGCNQGVLYERDRVWVSSPGFDPQGPHRSKILTSLDCLEIR